MGKQTLPEALFAAHNFDTSANPVLALILTLPKSEQLRFSPLP